MMTDLVAPVLSIDDKLGVESCVYYHVFYYGIFFIRSVPWRSINIWLSRVGLTLLKGDFVDKNFRDG